MPASGFPPGVLVIGMSTQPFQITVARGPDAGRVFRGQVGSPLRIGRGNDTETVLTDAGVSRHHCEIVADGRHVRLTHLSRTAPTFVNGAQVTEHQLTPGDEIQVADTVLVFYFVGDGQADTQPPAAGKVPAEELSALADRLVGTVLHRYTLIKKIAEGLTGMVFLATEAGEPQPLAVKIVWPHVVRDDASRQRFVRAMKTMYPIRHPHIVRIDNAGYTNDFCWVAMEYVDGENLRQMMDRLGAAGRLDWQNAYRVGVHIARGLVAAYEHQVVHRNILPQNILVRRDDKTALLGDLMLAKATEVDEAQQITKAGQLIGEVTYMSPERTGGTVEVDCRSDIYSLGATLYELVTGRPPFTADSLAGLLIAIRTTVPEPCKTYQLSVNDLFAGLIERMLAKDPARRPQTPLALLKELEQIGRMAGVGA